MVIIRLASAADAQGMLAIYARYISDTSITFETEVPSTEAFGKRVDAYLENWPWVVCEIDGTIAGYAYGARYRERVAYQWCMESSVYVHDRFQQQGVGNALYATLIEIAKRQGFYNLYAVINLPNEKSVAFHERLGFSYFATYQNVGYKLGQWKNVGWWQLVLNEYTGEPTPPVPFAAMNKDFLAPLFAATAVTVGDKKKLY